MCSYPFDDAVAQSVVRFVVGFGEFEVSEPLEVDLDLGERSRVENSGVDQSGPEARDIVRVVANFPIDVAVALCFGSQLFHCSK